MLDEMMNERTQYRQSFLVCNAELFYTDKK